MITTIIFDIGNVLTDFRWQEFVDSFDFSDEVKKRVGKAAMGSPAWNDFDRVVPEDIVLQEFIDNDPGVEDAIRAMFADISGTLKMYETSIPWLIELKEQGYRRLILSNLSEKTVRECEKDLRFFDHVDGGILSYRVGMIKPEPEIYKCLIRRYDLNPEECVFLDDREDNISTAKSLGINGIVFKDRPSALRELEALGVHKSTV